MNQRRIVEEYIHLTIDIKELKEFKQDITWKNLMNTKGVLPTDIFYDIGWAREKESGMFSNTMEEDLRSFYIPKLTIRRKRAETDKEYFERVKKEENEKKQEEEEDKLEYLRLKAKFEPTK